MTEDDLILVLIVFIVIAGVWLSILSFLVLSKMSPKDEDEEEEEKAEEPEEEAPKEEEETKTENESKPEG